MSDTQPLDGESSPQFDPDNNKDLNVDPSVLELLSQYQVLKVENLILGGKFGPGSVFGSGSSISAGTIANTIDKVSDPHDVLSRNVRVHQSRQTGVFVSTESTTNWFFSLQDAKKEVFVITVAIFGGNSSRFITTASDILYEQLAPSTDMPKVDVPISLFDRVPDDLLGDTATVREFTYFNTASGRTSVETVRFSNSRLQSQILELVSSNYRFIKIYDTLATWLQEFVEVSNTKLKRLGSFEPDLARTQAAIAIGVLAKREYKHYLDNIIQRWALAKDPLLRFAVGWVLLGLVSSTRQNAPSQRITQVAPEKNTIIAKRRMIPEWEDVLNENHEEVQDSTYLDNVVALLKHWIGLNNPSLQWTAITSASRIGLLIPDEVLKIIRPAAKSRFSSVRSALQITLGLLYLSGSAYARKVILELAQWCNDEDERIQDTACRQFITLVQGRFGETDNTIGNQINELSRLKSTGTRKSSLSLWDLIGVEDAHIDSTIFEATCTLLAKSLSHQDAKMVDITCDSIVLWMVSTDSRSTDEPKAALFRILRKIKSDAYLAQYIDYCLTYPEVTGNSIANRLLKQ